MTVFEILSIVALALGGIWGLLGFYFSQQREIEKTKEEGLQSSLYSINQTIVNLEAKIKEISLSLVKDLAFVKEGMSRDFIKFTDKLHEVEKQILENTINVSNISKDQAELSAQLQSLYRHFAGKIDDRETETVALGKETFLVRNKKPNDTKK